MKMQILLLWKFLLLIDTWWNVNANPRILPFCIVCVLIDTWWNVNTFLNIIFF